MTWKTLLVKFNKVNASLDGKHYDDTIDDNLLNLAEKAYYHFAAIVKQITSGLVDIKAETFSCNEIRSLATKKEIKAGKKEILVEPKDVLEHLEKSGKKIYIGEYDSIFAILPYENDKLNENYHLFAQGNYEKDVLGGVTYAFIPCGHGFWGNELEKFLGDTFLHEWLHGVCRFFRSRGFSIVVEESDGALKFGYERTEVGSWIKYYTDFINFAITFEGEKIGVPKEAWLIGTPSQPYLQKTPPPTVTPTLVQTPPKQ